MGNQLAAPARVQPGELLAGDVPSLVYKDSLGGETQSRHRQPPNAPRAPLRSSPNTTGVRSNACPRPADRVRSSPDSLRPRRSLPQDVPDASRGGPGRPGGGQGLPQARRTGRGRRAKSRRRRSARATASRDPRRPPPSPPGAPARVALPARARDRTSRLPHATVRAQHPLRPHIHPPLSPARAETMDMLPAPPRPIGRARAGGDARGLENRERTDDLVGLGVHRGLRLVQTAHASRG